MRYKRTCTPIWPSRATCSRALKSPTNGPQEPSVKMTWELDYESLPRARLHVTLSFVKEWSSIATAMALKSPTYGPQKAIDQGKYRGWTVCRARGMDSESPSLAMYKWPITICKGSGEARRDKAMGEWSAA
jgi:hypothetical protein